MTTVTLFHCDGKMNSYETHMQVYPSVKVGGEYEEKTVLPREDVNLTHLSFLSVWVCVIAEHTSVPLLASIRRVYMFQIEIKSSLTEKFNKNGWICMIWKYHQFEV